MDKEPASDEKFEREVKTLSLYLKGWTQEGIAETDGRVVTLVNSGAHLLDLTQPPPEAGANVFP